VSVYLIAAYQMMWCVFVSFWCAMCSHVGVQDVLIVVRLNACWSHFGASCLILVCRVSFWCVVSHFGVSCLILVCHIFLVSHVSGWCVMSHFGVSCLILVCHVSFWCVISPFGVPHLISVCDLVSHVYTMFLLWCVCSHVGV